MRDHTVDPLFRQTGACWVGGIADTPTDVLGKLEPGLAYCATDRAYAITAIRMAWFSGLGYVANSLAYQGRIVP